MLDKKLLKELEDYIQLHLYSVIYEEELEVSNSLENTKPVILPKYDIEDFIQTNRKPSLNQVLFSFIDSKGYKDSEVYKKARIDRRHFSKIRSNVDYNPSKKTMIALALALELAIEETSTLLKSTGYSLSDSDTTDLVIRFCLEKKLYDFDYVNQLLDYFEQQPLIGTTE